MAYPLRFLDSDCLMKLFASYNLWTQFEPPLGWEESHCHMQRGWRWIERSTADSAEPTLSERPTPIVSDTIWQKVGKFAQQGIYEFHQNPLWLKHPRGCERVADRLYLYYEVGAVRDRVMRVLQQYQASPWLLERQILLLNRGDEPIPPPIPIEIDDLKFDLLAVFDCIVRESEDLIQIVDFKTGAAELDLRQADVYLLAASYLYPNDRAIASFYNLETMQASEPIGATTDRLQQTASKLAAIAQLHQQQLQAYTEEPTSFERLSPPNPGKHCHYCTFNYRCEYAIGS